MRLLIPLLTCATLLFAAASAPGTIIDVPTAQPTIAAGLGAASPGDTVRVACDTYHESGLVLPSGVTLMSADSDSGCVVIDGDAGGIILTCDGTTGATVQGITFTDGSYTTGGAVLCVNASVLFDDCHFTGNQASISGGAIYWSQGTPQISGCTFTGNAATTAGGCIALYATGGSVTGCRFTDNQTQWGGAVFGNQPGTTTVFTECEFQSNVATNTNYGGGAVWFGTLAAPTLIECRFDQNEGAYGGAAYSDATATPTFVNCEFNDNSSVYHGGAFHGESDGTEFDGCEFTFNHADGGGAGALHFDGSNAVVTGCSFYKNEASWGGAVAASGDASLDITSSTVVENIVPRVSGGAGLYIDDGATATLDRTIVAFNRGGEAIKCESGGSATLTCSNVSNNDGGDWVDCIAGRESSGGNLHVDPAFCGLTEYGLSLCADSQCLATLNDCGVLIGAWPEGCAACGQPVESVSWGVIKEMYR